ncbi:hypothetical protein [Gloeocapsopsis sp. IPPAS B-1203]|uniref:hypothetical protein n=1 Tax=Gloeocapsopsis sp. IPPAS B-1203 TaxID=2049454 RepID=UPI00259FE6F2|nr:hypothetical protein [Gloeocapsopsis sp. IPPAS B-1203]
MEVCFNEAIAKLLEENRPYLELKRRGRPEEVVDVIALCVFQTVKLCTRCY